VKVTDGGGLSDTATYTITVTNLDEPPVVMQGQSFSVNENSGASAGSLGTVEVSDEDSTAAQLTFSLVASSAANNFRISSAGAITLAPSFSPDFEQTAQYSFEVKVTDQSGLTDTETVSVLVIDQNEQPSISAQELAIAE